MKKYLTNILLIVTLIHSISGLLSESSITKFNITLNNPTHILLEESGTKFIVWNNNS